MTIIIVGSKEGKRKVKWLNYFTLVSALSLVMGLGIGFGFFLLSDRWDHSSVLFGILMGVGITSIPLINGLRIPIKELPVLK
jgi:hypothetical protein